MSLGEYVGVRLTSFEQLKLAQKRLKRAGFHSDVDMTVQKLYVTAPHDMDYDKAKECAKKILESVLEKGKERVEFT